MSATGWEQFLLGIGSAGVKHGVNNTYIFQERIENMYEYEDKVQELKTKRERFLEHDTEYKSETSQLSQERNPSDDEGISGSS